MRRIQQWFVVAALVLSFCGVVYPQSNTLQDGEEAMEEYGVTVINGVAVRYRVIHRVVNQYTNRRVVHVDPNIGVYELYAEYLYGAQVEPKIVEYWTRGITNALGNTREILSCIIPRESLTVSRRTDIMAFGVPNVGDRIQVRKLVRYRFTIRFRVRETFGISFTRELVLQLWEEIHTFTHNVVGNWILKETELWEVVEVLEAGGSPTPLPPLPPPSPTPEPAEVIMDG
ncbi:MAG TPA: hypothetical protein EYG57_17190 [Planctomycetes bacterium]|nr:hypothetical protein [Planctomycetaceae bacterium]HIM31268.1 hypothetical protein [Planctomycetota bacterium]